MAEAPDRPQVDILAGDVSVVATGNKDDTLEEVQAVALETFETAVEEYVENRDGDTRF